MSVIFTFSAPGSLVGGGDVNALNIYESADAISFTKVASPAITPTDTQYEYAAGDAAKYYRLSFSDADGLESGLTDTLFGGDLYAEDFSSAGSTYINTYLDPMIRDFQRLGVYDEKGVKHQDGKIRFTYPRWNTAFRTEEIRKNGTLLTRDTDYTLDGSNGNITPIIEMLETDDILARYFFSYFSDSDLLSYLNRAVAQLNSKNPGSSYTLDTVPDRFSHIITQSAYVECLKRLLLDNMIWKNNLIWADPAGALNALTSALNIANQELTAMWADTVRRQFLRPRTIRAGRYGFDYTATGNNFWKFTVLGA